MKEVEPKIIFPHAFTESTFVINKVESRIQLDDSQLRNISSNWQSFEEEAKLKGGQVWDGTYYRLENVDDISNELQFSTIKYSTIRGLTHNQDLSSISVQSRPNHISTATLIQTNEGLFVFGVRNKNSMSSRSIDLIGGGLQPEELEVSNCKDIFANQKKEIVEELGISDIHISSMKGLGITLSSKYNVIFIFLTKLSLSKEELLLIFEKKTDDEMQGLEFIEETNLEQYLSEKGSYRPLTAQLYFRNK